MAQAKFVTSQFGEATREPGNKWAFWYFKPATIPRSLDLATATI